MSDSDISLEVVPISALQFDEHNANRGTERGDNMLRRSIVTNKAGRSILVDADGVTLGGNKTLRAAMDAGVQEVIVVRTDGTKLVAVLREDLRLSDPETRSDAVRLAYADNRTAEVGLSWDPAQIVSDLEWGLDLSDFWTPKELGELSDLAEAPEPGSLAGFFEGMEEVPGSEFTAGAADGDVYFTVRATPSAAEKLVPILEATPGVKWRTRGS